MSGNKLVLVVDDDPDLVEAISMKLEGKDYQVAKAYDGIEAWDRIREERPDLIILDVMMPRKNGYVLCDEIKNNPKYQDITVILLTGVASVLSSTTLSHQDGMNTLADDYIPKPIDLDKLMSMIGDYLS
jgi:CheY-like chemotaxis protein